MKIRKILLVLILTLSLVLSGCAKDYDAVENADDYSQDNSDPTPPAQQPDEVEIDGGDVIQSDAIPALLNRKIIYTANLRMDSPEPETIYNEMISNLDTYSAYVESASITSTKYTVKIRVLSINFTDFVEEIKTTGDVVSYSKTSEDVTNSYSTFEARKLALEAQHARILELIEVAVDLDDILTLEDARFDVVTELNEIGEALANYDSLVDYSTINLTIMKKTEAEIVLPQTDKPFMDIKEIGKNAVQIEVVNQDENPVVLYLEVYINGEFVREYDGEAFPDGSVIFEIVDLESNTEYLFKATAISADHRESLSFNRTGLTQSTFFNKVGNVFVSSFDILVIILEFLGLAVVAIAPFGVVFVVIYIPSRILYRKYGKQFIAHRKIKQQERNDQKIKDRIRREEEFNYTRIQQQKALRDRQNKQQQGMKPQPKKPDPKQ